MTTSTHYKTPLVYEPNTAEVEQAAMRTVARHATDAGDLRELLMMTGLIPSPEAPETEAPRTWHPQCIECGIGMFKREAEPVKGMRRHGGRGRCTACACRLYRAEKEGQT